MGKNEIKSRCEYPLVPRDFITAPIFASRPQKGSRIVRVGDRTYIIGGFKPISEDRPECPALDIRHGRALFTILSFVEAPTDNMVVRFSITEFCKRYASTVSGRYAQDMRALLSDLERCWFKITHPDGNSESYRILKNISVKLKVSRRKAATDKAPQEDRCKTPGAKRSFADEMWLDEVELHPKFFSLLQDYFSIAQIHLRTLTSIRSPLAQAVYVYIPSRAVHADATRPFEITLQNLLSQVGHTVPASKSLRKKIFTQNRNPVLEQLNNIAVVNGILKVNLVETSDKEDYKIQFWVEERKGERKASINQEGEGKSILQDIWLKAGKTLEEFREKTKFPLPELNEYQQELFKKGKIELAKNEIFFRKALALLGKEKFDELLSDAKSAVLEGRKATKSETHRLIYYIKDTLKRVAR